MKRILCMAMIALSSDIANGQLFTQDFSSSTNVNDYVSASPDNTQFTYIASSGPGFSFSINSGTLEMVRTANAGYINRSADFSPTPDIIKVQFDLEVPAVTASALSAAILRFGQGYSDNNATPANANTHSRLGINLVSGNGFQLRNIGTSTNSPAFNGVNTVTWWINNSGAASSYTAPDGTTKSVGNDKEDVWVGSTQVFDEMAAVTASAVLTDFKFIFDGGVGTIRLDNILITAESVLPIRLAHFYARAGNSQAFLSWRTATETGNDYFSVERSADGRSFAEIGRVAGAGTSFEPRDYAFTDEHPLPGINYYRLRQTDFDGTYSYSHVVTVSTAAPPSVSLFPVPAKDVLHIHLEKPSAASGVFEIHDPAGRLVRAGNLPEEIADHALNMAGLPAGVYTLRLRDGSNQLTVSRFHKQ